MASENSPSIVSRLAFLTDIFSRYYFPLDKYRHWAFPGNEFIERIYQRCEELLREATGAKYVSIKPISGVSAMTIALAALAKNGDTIATISPQNGGHTITSDIARRLGLRVVHLPYQQESFTIDTAAISDFLEREKASLIYLDQCHILFPYNLRELRARVPDNVKIYYDGSHVMGLIFGGVFQEPLNEGASFQGGSTHKTIPGPHKAFIATNDEDNFLRVEKCSNIFVSHDHGADVAALAIVLEEMRGRWQTYAGQVINNAQFLASALDEKGFTVIAKNLGFTKSHQIWLDIAPQMDPFKAAMTLADCNIIVNTISAPSVAGRLALRIGVQEATYLGATEKTMQSIAEIFEKIFISHQYNERKVREEVAEIKNQLIPQLSKDKLDEIFMLLRESLF